MKYLKLLTLIFLLNVQTSFADNNLINDRVNDYLKHLQSQQNDKKTSIKQMMAGKEYWKVKKGNYEIPHMRSTTFFNAHKPTSWTIEKTNTAGDFAKADVVFTIGDPLKVKTRTRVGKNLKKRITYSLVKDNNQWYLINFKNHEAIKNQKKARAYREDMAKTLDPGSLEKPSDIIKAFLTEALETIRTRPDALIKITNKTKPLWLADKRLNRRKTQHISQLLIIKDFNWEIISEETQANEAKIMVQIKNTIKQKIQIIKNPKYTYTLIQEQGSWKIKDVNSEKPVF